MIGSLQKVTLLDFPGKVACTVFLTGCNLRCPYCHNPELVLPRDHGKAYLICTPNTGCPVLGVHIK